MPGNQYTPSNQLVRSTPSHMVRSKDMFNNTQSHVVRSNGMFTTSSPSQMVRSSSSSKDMYTNTPSHIVRSSNLPTNTPRLMIRGNDMFTNNTPSHMVRNSKMSTNDKITTSQTRSLPRSSFSSQLPRNISVKSHKDGSNEFVVETSVSVSYTFQQGDFTAQDTGEKEHADHLPLEDNSTPDHQLVCCTCMMTKPSLQVGECGCLVCRLCLDQMERPGYCQNCQISVRYTELERIIRFPAKGQMGKLFMSARERENVSIKEFLSRVQKEGKDFKIIDRILNKQEAAFVRKNMSDQEELEIIREGEEELKRKIAEVEESIRSMEQQQQIQFVPRLVHHQNNLKQMSWRDKQQQLAGKNNHHHEIEKIEFLESNITSAVSQEDGNNELGLSMHDKTFDMENYMDMEDQDDEQNYEEPIEQPISEKLQKGIDFRKAASYHDEGKYPEDTISQVGSSFMGVVVSPVVGLRSILKKKISSRNFAGQEEIATKPVFDGRMTYDEDNEKISSKTGYPAGVSRGDMPACLAPWDRRQVPGGEEDKVRNITQVQGDLSDRAMPGRKMVETVQGRSSFQDINLLDNKKQKQDDPLYSAPFTHVENEKMSTLENRGEVSSSRSSYRSSGKYPHGAKSGLVSAAQGMDRVVRRGSSHGGPGTGHGVEATVSTSHGQNGVARAQMSKKRKTLPPLSSIRHPEAVNDALDAGMKKTREGKELHDMTYDYLDMIVGEGAVDGKKNKAGATRRPNERKEVKVQGGGHDETKPDPYGVQRLGMSGGVSGKNSQLFWDQYLL